MIVLSVLGLGRWNKETKSYEYEEAAYEWEGHGEVVRTTLVQEAFWRWYPEAEIIVLATEKAKRERAKDLQKLSRLTVVDIPDGKSEGEFWQIYNAITEALPKDSEVILDITHGLRSLPHLAFSALIFLKAAKHIQIRAVVYAANEARSPSTDHTPILDLTPFVTMLDWASATNRFLETGDASKFRPLVEAVGAKPMNTDLNSGVKLLDELSSALATNRAMRAGELSSKALAKIEQAKGGGWEPSHAPLKLLLPRLEQGLGLLARDNKGSQQDQLVQSFGQVSWFFKHRQYEKALGLAREWMVSFAQWKWNGKWLPVELDARKKTEEWLRDCDKGKISTPPDWAKFIGLWRDLGNLRNDLLHFGFRDAARKESAIPDEVREKIGLLRAAVSPLGLELPQESP